MAQSMPQPSRQQGKETRSTPAGKAVSRAILSEDTDWKSVAAYPPSVRLAVVVGQISEPGPYTIRVKVPLQANLQTGPGLYPFLNVFSFRHAPQHSPVVS